MQKRIFLSSPTMNGTEMNYINEAFETNWIAPLGKNVNELEKSVASYVGVADGAALSAGTAALHLAVKLAGIKPDDVVLCSDLTFAATVNPVSYEGGKQVFIDCEKDTWNMDPEALELAFEKYPDAKAVLLVNLYGTPAKLDRICELCRRHDVVLIEDAAESLGAEYDGKQTGSFGKYGVFSFNGNKIITSSGGGMLVSDDTAGIAKARFWATQSREPRQYYYHKELGYNYRMSNIVAGIARGQLNSLDKHIELKRKIYFAYKSAFSDIPEITMSPFEAGIASPNFWLSCISIAPTSPVKPVDVISALEADNIEARHIWNPMHCQPIYAKNDFITARKGGHSNSAEVFRSGLCLPSDIKNTDEDMERIISIVRRVFGR